VVLAAGVVIAVAFPILFDAWVYRHTGFELQARYVLPVLMIPCLVAGEIVRGRGQDRLRWPATVALLVIAVLQLDSWDTAARAASGHSGRVWFMPSAAWSPPLGWWPWAAVATAGALCLVLAAVQTARSSPMSPSLRE
jgi:hypothetical protein